MNTLMITSMDQGKGFAADALQPVPLFETAARVAAIMKAAIVLTLHSSATLRVAQA